MARNFNLFPPNPDLSASFIRSLAGSEPGLSINMIGEKGLDCSNIASKLITGGVTYFSLIRPVTKFVIARYTLSTRKQRRSNKRWKSVRLSSYLPGNGADSGASWSFHWKEIKPFKLMECFRGTSRQPCWCSASFARESYVSRRSLHSKSCHFDRWSWKLEMNFSPYV